MLNPLRQSGPPGGGSPAPRMAAPPPPPTAGAGDPIKDAILALAQAIESGQTQGIAQKVGAMLGGGAAPGAPMMSDADSDSM